MLPRDDGKVAVLKGPTESPHTHAPDREETAADVLTEEFERRSGNVFVVLSIREKFFREILFRKIVFGKMSFGETAGNVWERVTREVIQYREQIIHK